MNEKWIENWKSDLDFLAEELPKRHCDLFFTQSKEEFFLAVEQLKAELPVLDHFQVMAGIGEILAAFGDAHTIVQIPGRFFLPLNFYYFEEGVYVIGAGPGYENLIGKRLVGVEDIGIDEVTERLSLFISHENLQFLKSRIPSYLRVMEVLFGLEIAGGLEKIRLSLEDDEGNVTDQEVDAGKDEIRLELGQETLPLYRQNRELSCWSRTDRDKRLTYINYNSCRDRGDIDVRTFFKEMMNGKTLSKNLVMDLRNNLGGDSSLLDDFIGWLTLLMRNDGYRKLFIIVGRDTFSSALLNAWKLKEIPGSVLLGEATGGKPDSPGEVAFMELPASRLKIRYSTKFYRLSGDISLPSLFPELCFPVSWKDYRAGRDPVLEHIFKEVGIDVT